MLLYSVVTLFLALGAPEEPPIVVFLGTKLMTQKQCELSAVETSLYAKALIRKRKIPLDVETFCQRAGAEV